MSIDVNLLSQPLEKYCDLLQDFAAILKCIEDSGYFVRKFLWNDDQNLCVIDCKLNM